MTRLLRADSWRLRGRLDLLGLLLLVPPVLMAATLVNAYTIAGSGLNENRQVPISVEERARELAAFAFPADIVVVLSVSVIAFFVTCAFALVVLGEDFEYGTIRPVLHWAGSRSRYLMAKQLLLCVPVACCFGGGVLVAIAAPAVIELSGVRLASSTLGFLDIAPVIGARVLSALVFGFAAILAVILTRSIVRAALALTFYLILEATIIGLPIWPSQIAWVRELGLTRATFSLIAAGEQSLRDATGSVGDAVYAAGPPALVRLGIVVAWGSALVLAAHIRFRGMDITD